MEKKLSLIAFSCCRDMTVDIPRSDKIGIPRRRKNFHNNFLYSFALSFLEFTHSKVIIKCLYFFLSFLSAHSRDVRNIVWGCSLNDSSEITKHKSFRITSSLSSFNIFISFPYFLSSSNNTPLPFHSAFTFTLRSHELMIKAFSLFT